MTDYIDKQILRLNEQIVVLDAQRKALEDARKGGTQPFMVGMRENNSGGSYWLAQADYDALAGAGWDHINSSGYGRHAAKSFDATFANEAIMMAKDEFERLTDQNPDAIGCTCCGQPFYFSEDPYFIDEDED